MLQSNQIKQISIVSVAQALGLSLQKSSTLYKCVCPFHSEKTPSFTIYPDTNSWYCFGKCREGGDSIELVKRKLGVAYVEAVDWIEVLFGGSDNEDALPNLPQKKKPKTKTKKVLDPTVEYFHALLFHTKNHHWFLNRGLDIKSIEKFKFGWNGSRYVIPAFKDNKCLSLSFRASEYTPKNQPKYLNETSISLPYLWGINNHVKRAKVIIAMAGQLDAALAQQDGLGAVSTLTGIGGFEQFEDNWPCLWFPQATYLITCFDRNEAVNSSKLAYLWEQSKGRGTAFIHHLTGDEDDYTEIRQKYPLDNFIKSLYTTTNKPIIDQLFT